MDAESLITEQLLRIYPHNEAENISRLLVEHLTGLSPADIVKNKKQEYPLDKERIQPFIERLLLHEPIQYIMEKTWFYGMELFVGPAVLIPRPETEELADWVVKDVRSSGVKVFDKLPQDADKTNTLKIMDVCTGSGCIALALKKTMPLAEVWGCDISETALNIARRNGSALDIRVDFQGLDFLDPAQQKRLPSVDIVVCNPPYIPLHEKASIQNNVTDFEPQEALFVADNDPLIFYSALITYGQHRLHEEGRIYMEVHELFAGKVRSIFEAAGYTTEIRKDMQGKERMLRALK
ncbi:MAG: peptide chain release factor N(5)-glutamine methyltransferase [Flavisolibacter sp.]|nr:peptide chain release factor N(5)-glutamine methyltransferase [Flavisolibacter sp.]